MTAPVIRHLRLSLREGHKLLERVGSEYEWTYGMAHASTVGEAAKVTVSGSPSPVESVVNSRRKQAQAKACERAHEDVLDALGKLRSAESRLRRVQDRADPSEGFTALRFPRSVTRADLALAQEAQERRTQRDEGIP